MSSDEESRTYEEGKAGKSPVVVEPDTSPSSMQQDRSLDEWIHLSKKEKEDKQGKDKRAAARKIAKRVSRLRLPKPRVNSGSSSNQGSPVVRVDNRVGPIGPRLLGPIQIQKICQ